MVLIFEGEGEGHTATTDGAEATFKDGEASERAGRGGGRGGEGKAKGKGRDKKRWAKRKCVADLRGRGFVAYGSTIGSTSSEVDRLPPGDRASIRTRRSSSGLRFFRDYIHRAFGT